jgi:hypothetical protein
MSRPIFSLIDDLYHTLQYRIQNQHSLRMSEIMSDLEMFGMHSVPDPRIEWNRTMNQILLAITPFHYLLQTHRRRFRNLHTTHHRRHHTEIDFADDYLPNDDNDARVNYNYQEFRPDDVDDDMIIRDYVRHSSRQRPQRQPAGEHNISTQHINGTIQNLMTDYAQLFSSVAQNGPLMNFVSNLFTSIFQPEQPTASPIIRAEPVQLSRPVRTGQTIETIAEPVQTAQPGAEPVQTTQTIQTIDDPVGQTAADQSTQSVRPSSHIVGSTQPSPMPAIMSLVQSLLAPANPSRTDGGSLDMNSLMQAALQILGQPPPSSTSQTVSSDPAYSFVADGNMYNLDDGILNNLPSGTTTYSTGNLGRYSATATPARQAVDVNNLEETLRTLRESARRLDTTIHRADGTTIEDGSDDDQ